MAASMTRLVMVSLLIVPPVLFAGVDAEHSLLTAVLKSHVTDGLVDYDGISRDERFDAYLKHLSETDPEQIEDARDRLAFWINTYNAFTIKLIVEHKPKESIREIREGDTGPWDIEWIEIGGERYSLNGVEHKIIRPLGEPRIHFALVCAAVSCPPLRSEAYVGSRLPAQMDDNARQFLLDSGRNRYDASANVLYLSALFEWYGDDFVPQYGSASRYVLGVMGFADAEPKEIRYLPYDWTLNRQ